MIEPGSIFGLMRIFRSSKIYCPICNEWHNICESYFEHENSFYDVYNVRSLHISSCFIQKIRLKYSSKSEHFIVEIVDPLNETGLCLQNLIPLNSIFIQFNGVNWTLKLRIKSLDKLAENDYMEFIIDLKGEPTFPDEDSIIEEEPIQENKPRPKRFKRIHPLDL